MNFNYKRVNKKRVSEVLNVTKISRGELSKYAQVKFYVKEKPSADLKVVEWVNSTCVSLGEKIVFFVKVCNLGKDDASNVKVRHFVYPQENSVILSAVISKGNYKVENGGITWSLGELLKGRSAIAIIVVEPKKVGEYINLAFVKGDEHDPNLYNNFQITKNTVNSYLNNKQIILYLILVFLICNCRRD